MTPALLIIGVGLLIVGAQLTPGLEACIAGAAGCMLFNLGLNNLLWRSESRYVAYKFLAVWFMLQSVFLFLSAVIFPNYFLMEFAPLVQVGGKLYSMFVSYCLVPLMAVLFARLLGKMRGSSQRELYNYAGQRVRTAREYFRLPKLGGDFDAMLIVSALVSASIWVSTLSFTSYFFFFLRVLNRGLYFTPMVAGLYWGRNRLVQITWIIVLVVNLALALLTGNRSYGFLPFGYYGIGFILQQPTRQLRFTWLAVGLVALIPLLVASGVVSVLRDISGRTSIQSMNLGQVMGDLPDAISQTLATDVNTWDEEQQNALWIGLSRMVDATLLAVPNMTPEVVPYRGYGTLPEEIDSMVSIPALGIFPNLSGYDSRLLAIEYGFNVVQNYDSGTNTYSGTSVPFNIVADAWSRGGILSLVVQVAMALLVLTFAEGLCYRFLLARSVGLFALGRTIVVGLTIFCLSGSVLTEVIRQLFLTMIFSLICMGFLMMVVKNFLGGSQEAARPPPGPGPMGRSSPPPRRPAPLGPRVPRPFRA